MATNAHYLNQFISTTLSSVGGIDDSQTTGIILASVSGITTDKPGILCLSYSSSIDTTKAEWITYTSIDISNELQGVTRGAEGFSAKSHSNGVTVAFPISRSHINNLNDALIIGGDETNLLEGVLDEDDMASDSATKGATQQSIKAYVDNNPYGGWLTTGLTGVTVTRASIDDPTVVLTFAADVTDYIWKGSRIKLTEGGTTHYMIVSAAPSYSDPNTTVTCLMEIDTTTPTQAADPVDAGTITDVAYAPPKTYPKGFPISDLNWSPTLISTASESQTSPGSGTLYNIGSLSLAVPIGDWEFFSRMVFLEASATLGYRNHAQALSTSSSSVSDNQLVSSFQSQDVGDPIYTVTLFKKISLASKTTYYLIARTSSTNRGTISFRGDLSDTIIRATSTLL